MGKFPTGGTCGNGGCGNGKKVKNILFNPKKKGKKEMETLNVVMAIVGNLLVVGAFVWFITKRDKK